jgi:hypothetical protein
MQRLLPLLIGAVLLVGASPTQATPSYMTQLPTSSTFRCLNCHAVQDPPASNASLNAFGTAFKSNGFRWDRSLAVISSDGDNCTNGFELGDADGNGLADAGVFHERSNPGKSDCTLELTPTAFSALKRLFQ